MKEMKYLNRIADKTLDLRLEAFGAVQIAGPKWCGKTTTAERRAGSVIKMQILTVGRDIWLPLKQSHRYYSRVQRLGLLMNGRLPQ